MPYLIPQSSLSYCVCNIKPIVACFLRFLGPLPFLISYLDFVLIISTLLGFDSNPCSFSPVGIPAGSLRRSCLRICRNYTVLAPWVHLVGSLHSPATAGSRTRVVPQFQLFLSNCPTIIFSEYLLLLGILLILGPSLLYSPCLPCVDINNRQVLYLLMGPPPACCNLNLMGTPYNPVLLSVLPIAFQFCCSIVLSALRGGSGMIESQNSALSILPKSLQLTFKFYLQTASLT